MLLLLGDFTYADKHLPISGDSGDSHETFHHHIKVCCSSDIVPAFVSVKNVEFLVGIIFV
jgi:hypothetical protein